MRALVPKLATRSLRGSCVAWLVGLGIASASWAADVSLTLSDGPDPVGVGQLLTYNAAVSNAGPDPATGVNVIVAVPASVDLVGASTARGGCTVARPTRCSLGTLAPGGTVTIGVAVRPTVPGMILGTAAADAAALGDLTPANNRATATTQVVVLPGACANLRVGTPLADLIRGTVGGDRIFGGGGDDQLSGETGADCLDGGQGDDRLEGGGNADELLGGSGEDRLSGNADADVLRGGSEDDRLRGGAESDRLDGGGGRDRLDGGAGDDRLLGGSGADSIRGRVSDEDSAIGGPGRDRIAGAWTVVAGSGNDRISVEGGAEVDCGAGRDTVRATASVYAYNCERVVVKKCREAEGPRGRRRIRRLFGRRCQFNTRGRHFSGTVRDGGGNEPSGRRCRTRACRKCRRRKCKRGGIYARVINRASVPSLPGTRADISSGLGRSGR